MTTKREILLIDTRGYEELKAKFPQHETVQWKADTGIDMIPCSFFNQFSQGYVYRIPEQSPLFELPVLYRERQKEELLNMSWASAIQCGKTEAFSRVSLTNDFFPHVLTPYERRCNGPNGPRRGQRRLLALRKRRYAKRKRKL